MMRVACSLTPAIPELQRVPDFAPGDAIPIEQGKGWLLLVEPEA